MCGMRALDEFELILVECALKIMTLIQNEHVRSRPMLRTVVEAKECYHHRLEENLGACLLQGEEGTNCRSRFFFSSPLEAGHLPLNEYSEVVLVSHSDDFKLRCSALLQQVGGGGMAVSTALLTQAQIPSPRWSPLFPAFPSLPFLTPVEIALSPSGCQGALREHVSRELKEAACSDAQH